MKSLLLFLSCFTPFAFADQVLCSAASDDVKDFVYLTPVMESNLNPDVIGRKLVILMRRAGASVSDPQCVSSANYEDVTRIHIRLVSELRKRGLTVSLLPNILPE